jgi:hypothetical protein
VVVAVDELPGLLSVDAVVRPDDETARVCAAGQLDAVHRPGRVPTPGRVVDLAEERACFGERPAVVVAVLHIGRPRQVGACTRVHGAEQDDPAGLQVDDRRRVAPGRHGVRVRVGAGEHDLLRGPGTPVVLGPAHHQVDLLGIAAPGSSRFGESQQRSGLRPDDGRDPVTAVAGVALVEQHGLGDGGGRGWGLIWGAQQHGAEQGQGEGWEHQTSESGHDDLPSGEQKVTGRIAHLEKYPHRRCPNLRHPTSYV